MTAPIDDELPEGDWEEDLPEGDWEVTEPDTQATDLIAQYIPEAVKDTYNYLNRPGEPSTPAALSLLKGGASGATLGATEYIPGLGDDDSWMYMLGKTTGASLPISKLTNFLNDKTIKFAAKSKYAQEQLSALGNLSGWALNAGSLATAGTLYDTATEAVKGETPSLESFLKHGAVWVAIDAVLNAAGATGRFIKGILNKADQSGIPAWKAVDHIAEITVDRASKDSVNATNPARVANKAMSILMREPEVATGEMPSAVFEKSQSVIENLVDEILTKPIETTSESLGNRVTKGEPVNIELSTPPNLPVDTPVNTVIEQINESTINQQLDALSPRAITSKELGENLQKDIQAEREAAESLYKPAYNKAEEAAEGIMYDAVAVKDITEKELKAMNRINFKPGEYKQVVKTLEEVVEDLGFRIELDDTGKIAQITPAVDKISARNMIELSKRLNHAIDYGHLDPKITDRLKVIAKALKREIRVALLKRPKSALEKYNLAEELYAETAQRMGRDNIVKIRQTQSPENIIPLLEKPSTLEDLRPIITEKQMAQVERELLEKMKGSSHQDAVKQLRELRPHLSEQSRSIADNIIESKAPSRSSHIRKAQQEVLNDLAESFAIGKRPEKALKLYQTRNGPQIIEQALKDSPNKDKIMEYLVDQTFHDYTSSFVKDGVIDFKKLAETLKDPVFVHSIRELGGDGAVTFFKNLEAANEQLKRNVKLLDNLPFWAPRSSGLEKPSKAALQERATRGKHLIEKAKRKGKALTPEQEVFEKTKAANEARTKEVTKKVDQYDVTRGEHLLNQAARRTHPFKFKLLDWAESLSPYGKKFLSMLGLYKFGAGALAYASGLVVPQTIAAYVGFHLLYKLVTKHRVRKAFQEVLKSSRKDPTAFITAYETLEDELED